MCATVMPARLFLSVKVVTPRLPGWPAALPWSGRGGHDPDCRATRRSALRLLPDAQPSGPDEVVTRSEVRQLPPAHSARPSAQGDGGRLRQDAPGYDGAGGRGFLRGLVRPLPYDGPYTGRVREAACGRGPGAQAGH